MRRLFGQQPAGLAYSAQAVSATGSTQAAIALDVRSLVSTMTSGGVPLRGSVFLMSSEAHSFLSSLNVLDASRTTLAGLPIVNNCPSGTFMLLNPSYLSYATGDGAAVALSNAAMIELDSAPSGDALTPTAATANRISLFQSDAVAVKALLDVSWQLSGPTDSSGNFASCVKLTGSSYA